MAEFGVKATELAGASGAGSAPQEGVVGPTKQFDGNWLSMFKPIAEVFAGQESASADRKLIAASEEYARGADKINQALATGQITDAESRRQMSVLWSRVQTNNPDVPASQLQHAMSKQFKDIKEASGIDQAFDQAKAVRQVEDRALEEGVKAGLFKPEMLERPETRQVALETVYNYNNGVRQLNEARAAAEEARKQTTEGRTQITFQQTQAEYKAKKAGEEFWLKTSENYQSVFVEDFSSTLDEIKNGANAEESLSAFKQRIAVARMQVKRAIGFDSGLNKEVDGMFDFYEQRADYLMDPTKRAEFDKARLQQDLYMTTAGLRQQFPDLIKLQSFVDALGPNALATTAAFSMTNKLMESLTNGSKGVPTDIVNLPREEQKLTFDSLNKVASNLKSGTVTNAAQAQETLAGGVKSILQGLGKVLPTDQVKLNDAMNFLGGESVKYLIEKDQLSAQDLVLAGDTYQMYVRDALLSNVAQALLLEVPTPGNQLKTSQPLVDLVDITVGKDGNVSATVKPEVLGQYQKDTFGSSHYLRVLREIRNMNSKLGGLTTAIRVGAHVKGRTDYQKFFEENRDRLLFGRGGNTPQTGDAQSPRGSERRSLDGLSGDDLFSAVVDNLLVAESNATHRDKDGKLITSKKGAKGVSQVMDETGVDPGYGVAPLKNESEAEYRRFGKDYLAAMLKEFGNDYSKAVAAYNAGPGSVKKAVEKAAAAGDESKWTQYLPKKSETIPYMEKILGRAFNG